MLLEHKVAIVTGGDSGIGHAIAVALAAEGARVTVNYHVNEDAARATLETIEHAGGRGRVQRADVSTVADIEALVRDTVEAFGRLDVMVNNGGVELAPHGITVVGVAPGAVHTPIDAATLADPAQRAKLESAIPLGRVAEPEEIARLVAFLASDQASYGTATTYTVDGGMMQASVGLQGRGRAHRRGTGNGRWMDFPSRPGTEYGSATAIMTRYSATGRDTRHAHPHVGCAIRARRHHPFIHARRPHSSGRGIS